MSLSEVRLQRRICTSPDSFMTVHRPKFCSLPCASRAIRREVWAAVHASEWLLPQMPSELDRKPFKSAVGKSVVQDVTSVTSTVDQLNRPMRLQIRGAGHHPAISRALLLLHRALVGANHKTWPGRHSTHTSLRHQVVQHNRNGRLPNPNGTCRHHDTSEGAK